MRRIVLIILMFLGAISIILLYFGIASLITFIVLNFILLYLVDSSLGYFYHSWKKSNYRITYWTLFIGVILIELTLRFVSQNHLSYSERNGSFLDFDPYNNKLASLYRNKTVNDAGYSLNKPNSCIFNTNTEFNYEHCYNDIGIRDRTYSKEEIDSNLVILGLGDSFTEGVGAPQDSSWSKQLETKIRIINPNTIVINGGYNGSDIIFEWYKLEHKLYELYKPDIVIITINDSDIQDLIYRGGKERFLSTKQVKFKDSPWWIELYTISHIARLIIHDGFNIEWHYLSDTQYQLEVKLSKKIIKDIIEKDIQKLAIRQDFKLMMVFTPHEDEINNKTLFLNDVYNSIDITNSKFSKISLLNKFLDINYNDSLSSYFWPIDRHCTSMGYNVWAEEIYSELLRNQWLNKVSCE